MFFTMGARAKENEIIKRKENKLKGRKSPFFLVCFLFPVFFSFQFEATQG